MTDSALPSSEPRRTRASKGNLSLSTAKLFLQTGLALLGIFLAGALISPFPYQPLQVLWLQRFCDNLQAGGIFALLGGLLVVASKTFGSLSLDSQKTIQKLRRAAQIAAAGWFLLIPLQIWAGVQLNNQARLQGENQLFSLRKSIALFKTVSTESELRQIVNKFPDAPPVPDKLDLPIPVIRDKIVTALNGNLRTLQENVITADRQRWQAWSKEICKGVVTSAFFGYGFLALAGEHFGPLGLGSFRNRRSQDKKKKGSASAH